MCLGLAVASVQILPLAAYLARSPVWNDRRLEHAAWWKLERPRLLELACAAVPYVYGSQRRGQPNLARPLGVNNLNESAGGFAGLGTLLWLAPLAVVTRGRSFRVAFLAGLALCGLMGAARIPPVDNLLRALPVLEVTDNRRLSLWVAFALVLLGGIGLDSLEESRRLARAWIGAWIASAMLFVAMATILPLLESRLTAWAVAHYRESAAATAGADALLYRERALRQVSQALYFLPRYYGLIALELGFLAALVLRLRARSKSLVWVRPAVVLIVLGDLAGLGLGLNPAISANVHSYEPLVIARLCDLCPLGGRALGLGEELPPNVLMRFGLSDIRNYDSVELATSLRHFKPLYEPAAGVTSRSEITWARVAANLGLLRESGVYAVVAAAPPPEGAFGRVEQIGKVFSVWLEAMPWAVFEAPGRLVEVKREDGSAQIRLVCTLAQKLVLKETFDPGWQALLDGKPVTIRQNSSVFMQIDVPEGEHNLILRFFPAEVQIGLAVSFLSSIFLILVLTGIRIIRIPGIATRGGLDGAEPAG